MQRKPKANPKQYRARHWTLGALAVVGVGALITAYTFRNEAPAEPAVVAQLPPIPQGISLTSWYQNGEGGRYILQLADGDNFPIGPTISGVVTSDTNCAPDAQGLSHCRNGIALPDGRRLTVIDTHMMSRNPCLEPGERISMTSINTSWLVAMASQPRANP